MMAEKTLMIVKPDAVGKNVIGQIIGRVEGHGFIVKRLRMLSLSREMAESFYEIHKERPFFGELVDFMISGPVLVQVLEADNAVIFYREIMGSTNPEEADSNTIRKLFGKDIQCNAVHGSDSEENAIIEASFFFSQLELLG